MKHLRGLTNRRSTMFILGVASAALVKAASETELAKKAGVGILTQSLKFKNGLDSKIENCRSRFDDSLNEAKANIEKERIAKNDAAESFDLTGE